MKKLNLMARFAVVSTLALGVVVPSFAHHSQTMFDLNKNVTLKGTVTEVDWANPHTFYYVDVVDSGKKVNWGLEGNSPNGLAQMNWTEDTVKVGDTVTFIGNPRKDGQPTMLLQSITAKDGKGLRVASPLTLSYGKVVSMSKFAMHVAAVMACGLGLAGSSLAPDQGCGRAPVRGFAEDLHDHV